MSRSQQNAQRTLTLPEELEKLEQSITLTLQEIDSNFSRAHRIVTTSILPIVEQYAKHSEEVWEGSKFWKGFFEASANVSLSGYEETVGEEGEAGEDGTLETTSTQLETPSDHVGYDAQAGAVKEPQGDGEEEDEEEFSVDSPTQVTGLQATPKLPSTSKKAPNGKASGSGGAFRSPSPRKYTGKNPLAMDPDDEPSTPRQPSAAQSSPFQPESAIQPLSGQISRNGNNDPLMHRGVLDKNYRIQATPHTQRREKQKRRQQQDASAVKTKEATSSARMPWDDSPQSSPAMAAPQLRSDFFSPAKIAPRTPGVSVLTPARNKTTTTTTAGGTSTTYTAAPTTSTGRQLFSPQDKAHNNPLSTTNTRASNIFSSPDGESEDGDDIMSPPKTLQFHVPTSRLVQTPAREASKKIVEDLLLTAGADATDDIEGIDDPSLVDEPSPSVVRGFGVGVEDSF